MRFLQVMPPEESILGVDEGLVLTLSVALIGGIFLYDRAKAVLTWIIKRKN